MDDLASALIAGDRRALARAITLIESVRADHRTQADALLGNLAGADPSTVRIGISGPPGVGKSTFIEALGMQLLALGHKVAVLAVDPSSQRSGGSILGDKTRMERLSREPNAFIRPSPASGELGGVARRSREAMRLCEAAGFNVVIVETVGVGQSETAVSAMTDLFVLLASPAGGDDLQGVKRGIMEMADLVVVTKADGDLTAAAQHSAADLRHALHLLQPRHSGLDPEVFLVSSTKGTGVTEVWDAIDSAHRHLLTSGQLAKLRTAQLGTWFWSELRSQVESKLFQAEPVQAFIAEQQEAVQRGAIDTASGVAAVIARLGLQQPPPSRY